MASGKESGTNALALAASSEALAAIKQEKSQSPALNPISAFTPSRSSSHHLPTAVTQEVTTDDQLENAIKAAIANGERHNIPLHLALAHLVTGWVSPPFPLYASRSAATEVHAPFAALWNNDLEDHWEAETNLDRGSTVYSWTKDDSPAGEETFGSGSGGKEGAAEPKSLVHAKLAAFTEDKWSERAYVDDMGPWVAVGDKDGNLAPLPGSEVRHEVDTGEVPFWLARDGEDGKE